MSRVAIVVDVADEYADPDDDTGLTPDGYETLVVAMTGSGVATGIIDVTVAS